MGREKAFGQIEQKTSLLNQLTADISALEEKVEKQERPVEKDKVHALVYIHKLCTCTCIGLCTQCLRPLPCSHSDHTTGA